MGDEKLYHEHLHGPWHEKWGIWHSDPEVRQGGAMERRTMRQTTYEYLWPFEYPNFTIRSSWWGERHGRELDLPPAGYITVVEEQPIVAVTVIGSACSPPGWIMIEGERAEDAELASSDIPVRMRAENLWGTHMRWDVKGAMREVGLDPADFWMSGMSSAHFHIPRCGKVTISGGSQVPGTPHDQGADDAHYTFRIIRLTVDENTDR
jgi:hypothetical protein